MFLFSNYAAKKGITVINLILFIILISVILLMVMPTILRYDKFVTISDLDKDAYKITEIINLIKASKSETDLNRMSTDDMAIEVRKYFNNTNIYGVSALSTIEYDERVYIINAFDNLTSNKINDVDGDVYLSMYYDYSKHVRCYVDGKLDVDNSK